MIGSLEGDTSPVRWVSAGRQHCCRVEALTFDPWFQIYPIQSGRQLFVQRSYRFSAGLWLGARPLLRCGASGLGEGV